MSDVAGRTITLTQLQVEHIYQQLEIGIGEGLTVLQRHIDEIPPGGVEAAEEYGNLIAMQKLRLRSLREVMRMLEDD